MVRYAMPEILEEDRRMRAVVSAFVDSAASGDVDQMLDAIADLDIHCDASGWARAFRAIARLGAVPSATQEVFLRVHLKYGDHIRQQIDHDLVLVDGLRVLLPSYSGPDMTLYRGESFYNRRRRTYGLSWSASREVADGYASRGLVRSGNGGSFLLEADVPAQAIVGAVPEGEDRYGELEYLVDRRLICEVRVLARYPEQPSERGHPR